eukprot:119678-Prorocentrum_minimum.AAC.2
MNGPAAVVEVSSYQMLLPGNFHPRVGLQRPLRPLFGAVSPETDTFRAIFPRDFSGVGVRAAGASRLRYIYVTRAPA